MPFVPLDPKEKDEFKEPCRSPEHDPPSHMVITRPMKWVCPACKCSVIIRPDVVRCTVPPMGAKWGTEVITQIPEQELNVGVKCKGPDLFEDAESIHHFPREKPRPVFKLTDEMLRRLRNAPKQLVNLRLIKDK